MRAGDLRHRVQIQIKTVARATDGSEIETWITLATVWAAKAHQASREFFAAQKVNAEVTDLFTIRYRAGVTSEMRLVFGGVIYDIIGAPDPDGGQRELRLLCKAVV